MEKFINKLIDRYGIESLLHFGYGGLLCAVFSIIFYLSANGMVLPDWIASCLFGSVVTLIVSWLKEMTDESFDIRDVMWSTLGTLPVWMAFILGMIIR